MQKEKSQTDKETRSLNEIAKLFDNVPYSGEDRLAKDSLAVLQGKTVGSPTRQSTKS